MHISYVDASCRAERTQREVNHLHIKPLFPLLPPLVNFKALVNFSHEFPFPANLQRRIRECNERKSYERPLVCLNAFTFRDNDRKEIIKLSFSLFFKCVESHDTIYIFGWINKGTIKSHYNEFQSNKICIITISSYMRDAKLWYSS